MNKVYELEKGGLDELIKDIEFYKHSLQETNKKITDDLSELGFNFIKSNVGLAQEEDQRTDVLTQTIVRKSGTKNSQTRTIVNASPKVAFSEFGYGMKGEQSPYQFNEFIDSSRAGYVGYNLDTPAKRTDASGNKYWFYRNSFGELMKSYGEMPSNLFYYASRAILTSIDNVLRARLGNLWGKR